MLMLKTFKPTTGTIFDFGKIPVCECMEYCLNTFRYISLNADLWNNRNAISTSKYWLEKLFLTLESTQNNVILSDAVWHDENYYALMTRNRTKDDDGKFLRGLSRNQISIGDAIDKKQTICFVKGLGNSSQKLSYNTFKNHILPG